MKRKTIEITIRLGDREIADDVITTWSSQITKSDIYVPPNREARELVKYRCYNLVKCLLSAIEEEHDQQQPPTLKTVHKRRRND